ncbi:MAG TPA: zf-HC2 domain-containing protein [Methylomirabilota bacterium]|jgi:anti-sigma factor RsiW|nr:zf-HC2 domain-containing protein [Methylomirabilota bacterium]
MDCQEAREILEEYRRGELPADAAATVEAHLARCPRCRGLREEADAMAAGIRALPRSPAPAALARRLERLRLARPRPAPIRWLARPWVAAAAAAVLVAAVLAPWVQFRGRPPEDPLERLVQSSLTEHTRILLQLQAVAGEVSDPASAFATLRSLTDVQVPSAFAGDEELTLLEARPTVIANRKAAAVVLRDQAWFITTYFALHGQDLPMPNEGRVQIDTYRPYMRQVNGFHVIYWKQGDYAYLMVSDLDDPRSRQLFLKMRKAL